MTASVRYQRSPWLALEWCERATVLVACATGARYEVEPSLVGLLARLGSPACVGELQDEGFAVSGPVLARLAEHGVVHALSDEAGAAMVDWWHPFDLDVQRHGALGSGFRQPGPPPPAFDPPPPGRSIKLPVRDDLGIELSDALRSRRSVREYSPGPLELEQLGSLLHHAARVETRQHDDELGELAFRPFASAGARSELELYVLVNDVRGLRPGPHYYDAREDRLVQVRGVDVPQAELNASVATAMGGTGGRDPQVALIVAAAVPRIFWKYGRLGLSLIYQDLGCLYQALYLVATALGLAPCAIGGGCSVEHARWLGLDPFLKPALGCFAVGRPA